jgi:rod shape determining protein RodA
MATTTAIPRGNPAASLRRNPASPWRHLDLGLIGATAAIALIGVLMVWSATRSTVEQAGLPSHTFLVRQAMYVVVGAGVLMLVTFFDYRRFYELAPAIYGGGVLLLVGVLTPLGQVVNGSRSWYGFGAFQLQPSEPMKVGVILLLAGICANHRGNGVVDARRVVLCLVAVAVPAVLIMLQPDLGSMLVYVAIVIGVLLVAGAPARHLAAIILAGVIGVIGVVELGFIEDYQMDRFTSFVDAGSAGESGYNAQQAQTAIGAGGVVGAGLFQGTQTKLEYVPEQQTDFIFTVVGEELGFLGSATLLILYGVVLWRIWRASAVARDAFGTLVCAGVFCMILFQVFENMGMAMGIMPITGIPLPLVSFGGSSTITTFAAIGLVLNVHTRRFS